MIIKRRPDANFTIVPNGTLDDARLSCDELGVLVYLLGRPANWEVSAAQLGKRFDIGRDKVYRLLGDLVEKGFIERIERRGADGRIAGTEYVVGRDPVPDSPRPEKPDTEKPDTEKPDTNKEGLSTKKDSQQSKPNGLESGKPSLPLFALEPPPDRSDGELPGRKDYFEQWWAAYPRKAGKIAAEKAYAKALKRASPAELLAGAIRYQDDPKREAKFTAHPATWLNAGRWLDESDPTQGRSRMENWARREMGIDR